MTDHRRRGPARRRRGVLVAAGLVTTLTAGLLGYAPSAQAGAPSPALESRVAGAVTTGAPAAAEKPNIVLISSDDQADVELTKKWMPQTWELLVEEGITFTDAINPHPLCCPARAEILTGEYAQNNKVAHNSGSHGGWKAFVGRKQNIRGNLGQWLRDAGYKTGFVGKTLNGYAPQKKQIAGWTSWQPTTRGTYGYYGTTFEENGEQVTSTGYVADRVADKSVALIDRWHRGRQPFFIWASHVGPHKSPTTGKGGKGWGPPIPAKRHRDLYRKVDLPGRGTVSFNEDDVSDKPEVISKEKPFSASGARRDFRKRLQSLRAIDEANAAMIEALDKSGELANTVVVYVSDNGYQLGQHRLFDKNYPYQENLQIPFAMRGPGVPRGQPSGEAVSLVDLAPTLLEYAGALGRVRASGRTDGESLVPVLAGERSLSTTSLIQGGRVPDPRTEHRKDMAFWLFRGVRTPRYTWVRYYEGSEELYDRAEDPFEVRNVIEDDDGVDDVPDALERRYATVRDELVSRYAALKKCAGVEACERQSFGAVPSPSS